MDGTLMLIGTVGRPHGLVGEVHVRLFSDEPDVYLERKSFLVAGKDGQPVVLAVRQGRPAPGGLLIRFAGVEDRDAAEALRGRELFVERGSLPDPEDGSYYYADLEGLSVILRREDGSESAGWGTVRRVFSYGAGDILEIILQADQTPVFVPFIDAAVPEVRLAERCLFVTEGFAEQEAWCVSGS